MAINISQAFHRTSPNPVDETMALTKAQMASVNDNIMPDRYFTVCQDDGEIYLYDKSATASEETGKFRNPSLDKGIEISKADFDALTEEEKNCGIAYYIPDTNIVNNLMVVGNKFDKANLYSSIERMIGSWMDKPLYQKTIHLDNPEGTTVAAPHNISDAGMIVGIEAVCRDGLNYYQLNSASTTYTTIWADATNINIQTTKDKIADEVYVTLRYTKASDGTTSIGVMNDYTTAEVRVGTWINGKAIYQRTYDLGSNKEIANPTAFAKTGGIWFNLGIDRGDIDQIVSAEFANTNGVIGISMMSLSVGSTNKLGINNGNCRGISIRYVTLRYTKTTD